LKVAPGLSAKQAKQVNQQLADVLINIQKIFNEANRRGETLTHKKLSGYLHSANYADFVSYAHHVLDKKLRLQEIQKSTLKSYHQALRHLTLCNKCHIITFADMADMPREIEGWMKKADLGMNTRKKTHTRLKSLLREAVTDGHLHQDPYESAQFKIGTIKGDRQSLTAEELKLLMAMYRGGELPDHLQNTLQYFLFSCFTGVRFGDLQELTTKNIVDGALRYVPEKTKRLEKLVQMKLPQPAKELLTNTGTRLFHVLSAQVTNRNIKEITAHAGIKKHITMHCARHTFGTLFCHFGGSVAHLQAIMGHSKLETTGIYLHMAESIKHLENPYFDSL
jgi:site-specific recombinase XerD